MSNTDGRFTIVLRDDDVDGPAAVPKFDIDGANATGGAEQPSYWIDQAIGKSHVLQANMTQVTHGSLVNGGSPASLIILQFEFQPKFNNKRFKSVEVTITFKDGESGSGVYPEILDISPKGTWGLMKSRKKTKVSHAVKPGLEAGGGPFKAKLGYEWQLKTTSSQENHATVIGIITGLGADRAKKNTVTWNINENPDTKKGIPTHVQAAILLKRTRTEEDPLGEKFSAKIHIKGKVNRLVELRNKVENVSKTMAGEDEKGEDVTFNPELDTGAIQDKNNLRKQDLTALQEFVTFQDGEKRPKSGKRKSKGEKEDDDDDEDDGDEDEDEDGGKDDGDDGDDEQN